MWVSSPGSSSPPGRSGARSTSVPTSTPRLSPSGWPSPSGSSCSAPLAGGAHLPQALLLAAYPTADALLLALAVHLTIRLGTLSPAMAWFLAGIGLLVVLDICISLAVVLAPSGQVPALAGGYVFFFGALAMSASHPTIADVTRRPPLGAAHRRGSRRTALIVLTISPAILATVMPLSGMIDGVLRAALVTLLLGLLLVRLSRTLSALGRAEADSRHRATHDPLTGLLNRAALADRLVAQLAQDRIDGRGTALLFFDCDDFKHVNDTWGHGAGDTLLRDVAARLPRAVGSHVTLARHGGDEFVALAAVRDSDEAQALADRVRAFFEEPLAILPDRRHAMTCSIGFVVADADDSGGASATEIGAIDDEAWAAELLKRADVAMYEAKTRGRGQCVRFDDALAAASRLRSQVGDRLGTAIRDGQFSVHLQPIVALDGPASGGASAARASGATGPIGPPGHSIGTPGRLVAWEALARWEDPQLGWVPPDVFVAVAEQLGLICDLGEVVLRAACADLARLRAARPLEDLSISINVSPAQLVQPDFAQIVRDAVTSAGLPPHTVLLEVTETLLVDKGPDLLATLADLRTIGVLVGIDDFGTGYASLSRLLRLPVDCVKIDRSLIAPLGTEPDATRRLGAVLALVRSLGIERIVAEGVETLEQVVALTSLGCPLAQGWLFGRAASLEAILAEQPTDPVSATGSAGDSVGDRVVDRSV